MCLRCRWLPCLESCAIGSTFGDLITCDDYILKIHTARLRPPGNVEDTRNNLRTVHRVYSYVILTRPCTQTVWNTIKKMTKVACIRVFEYHDQYSTKCATAMKRKGVLLPGHQSPWHARNMHNQTSSELLGLSQTWWKHEQPLVSIENHEFKRYTSGKLQSFWLHNTWSVLWKRASCSLQIDSWICETWRHGILMVELCSCSTLPSLSMKICFRCAKWLGRKDAAEICRATYRKLIVMLQPALSYIKRHLAPDAGHHPTFLRKRTCQTIKPETARIVVAYLDIL